MSRLQQNSAQLITSARGHPKPNKCKNTAVYTQANGE